MSTETVNQTKAAFRLGAKLRFAQKRGDATQAASLEGQFAEILPADETSWERLQLQTAFDNGFNPGR
jgi:hypothetical protein